MLVIRLSRVGKKNQAAFRITLSEKTDAVKGANHEILGHYNPSDNKKLDFNKERIEYWISKGARPSDSVASLLKTNGMSGLDKFLELRNKKKRSKSAPAEEKPAAATVAVAESAQEPAAVAAVEETPVAEASAEETPVA